MKTAVTRDELDAALAHAERPLVVVMTMGALHAGHASLFELAKVHGNTVVATIFVNPTQFGPNEDFDAYPRTMSADLDVCREHGVDVAFTPTVEVMYPDGPESTVHVGRLGEALEGAARPGHFDGMATVVTRLMDFTGCDVAIFGEKDYQQLAIVREVVSETGRAVRVVGAPTVREPDGLAMSSRNRYLSASGRSRAAVIPRALAAAGRQRTADAAREAALEVLNAEPAVAVEYVAVTSTDLGAPPDAGEARILIAAKLEGVRLIDNAKVILG